MRRRSWCLLLAPVLLLSAWPLSATMVRSAGLEETIDASLAIVSGRVLGQRPFRLADGTLMTAVSIRIEESLKGPFRSGERIEISAWGGKLGGERRVALGEAVYRRGERVLLQLEEIDGRLQTIGLAMGKWNRVAAPDGRERLVRDLSDLGVAGPRMSEGPLPLERFRRLVAERGGRRHE